MGIKKFDIRTYHSFKTPVVEFEKRIYDKDGNTMIITPGKDDPTIRGFNSLSIDIHEIGEDDESKKPIRKVTDGISIELIPDWVNKVDFYEKVLKIL